MAVAGYTKLMEADEEATVAAWRRLHETSADIELPPSLQHR